MTTSLGFLTIALTLLYTGVQLSMGGRFRFSTGLVVDGLQGPAKGPLVAACCCFRPLPCSFLNGAALASAANVAAIGGIDPSIVQSLAANSAREWCCLYWDWKESCHQSLGRNRTAFLPALYKVLSDVLNTDRRNNRGYCRLWVAQPALLGLNGWFPRPPIPYRAQALAAHDEDEFTSRNSYE